MTLGMYEILRAGGFVNGGLNFDSKLRRQSTDRTDLFHAHIGGMDTMARALLAAGAMWQDGALEAVRRDRYAAWSSALGGDIMAGRASLRDLHDRAVGLGEPSRSSGRQEALENMVARYVERAR
jgi:xylose isomerase